MHRFSALLAIVLLLGAMQLEAFSAWPARRTLAGAPLPAAYSGRYGYGPGWAYSSYYGGPVYRYYANPNAMLPPAPAYPTWPSYGFTYNNLYPGATYNYGWYVFHY